MRFDLTIDGHFYGPVTATEAHNIIAEKEREKRLTVTPYDACRGSRSTPSPYDLSASIPLIRRKRRGL